MNEWIDWLWRLTPMFKVSERVCWIETRVRFSVSLAPLVFLLIFHFLLATTCYFWLLPIDFCLFRLGNSLALVLLITTCLLYFLAAALCCAGQSWGSAPCDTNVILQLRNSSKKRTEREVIKKAICIFDHFVKSSLINEKKNHNAWPSKMWKFFFSPNVSAWPQR